MAFTMLDPLPEKTASFIGIIVAISGNVVISLALNCQKLAHRRIELERSSSPPPSPGEEQGEREPLRSRSPLASNAVGYGATRTPTKRVGAAKIFMPLSPRTPKRTSLHVTTPILEEGPPGPKTPGGTEDLNASAAHANGSRSGSSTPKSDTEEQGARGKETDYLKSKLWWFGFLLLNVGEFGNFLSYAYAPASVVAPLGTFALIANCFFAPLLLKERFKRRDWIGIALAIIGAITVVSASKQSDVRLDPDALIKALQQRIFIIYSAISIALAAFLAFLSEGEWGQKWVFIDVGLCAVFGGFTVLSTKAFSTLLSLAWIEIYRFWITYPVLLVLVGTGVGQVKYLNRALQKFDSKVVIPTQFVMFNVAAIFGSAILYRDFENVTFHRMITFIYGIATTFFGVYLLTRQQSGPSDEGVLPSHPEDPTTLIDSTDEAAIVIPKDTPILRARASAPSLGISPGKYLLLAASPPSEGVRNAGRHQLHESDGAGSVSSRRRTIGYGESPQRRGTAYVESVHSLV